MFQPDESDGLGMQPRIPEPESALIPGMACQTSQVTRGAFSGPQAVGMPDTSQPGPVALQTPVVWTYDFDPATAVARATFNGEVTFTSGGPILSVTSYNGRTGAVIPIPADLTAMGGVPEAPTDGKVYGRVSSLWQRAVAIAGDTMTGVLNLLGVTDGSNAAVGEVGEWIEANVPWGTGVALSNGVAVNATSISLTPGDWDVSGSIVYFGATSTAVATLWASISQTSATLNQTPVSCVGGVSSNYDTLFNGGGVVTVRAGPTRISLTATTTIYLVASAGFTTSTCQIYGANINARRIR